MKNEEKIIGRSCATCEFNCGMVCCGMGTRIDTGKKTYGMAICESTVMFPEGCDDYGISLQSFIVKEQMKGR